MILRVLKNFPWFLFGGMGAVGALFLFVALWQWGHNQYGPMALPAPLETFQNILVLMQDEAFVSELRLTLARTLSGFAYSALIGTVLGFLTGASLTASIMSRPIITVVTGIPPIAWIVLAMLWFGFGGQTVVFTVIVSTFPIIFVGSLQASRAIEGNLKEMVDSLNLGPLARIKHFYIPHLFSHIFPSWVSALGMSWKVVVMAELLSANEGVGSMLGIARARLETTDAFSLVALMVGFLLFAEYVVMEPIRREVESWRD